VKLLQHLKRILPENVDTSVLFEYARLTGIGFLSRNYFAFSAMLMRMRMDSRLFSSMTRRHCQIQQVTATMKICKTRLRI
jgi:hypothetical protein